MQKNENEKISEWDKKFWPESLFQIPQIPKSLKIRGEFNNYYGSADFVRLCVVGPRKYSDYGQAVCQKIISGLSNFPITIVSGLAYGIDSIAHQTALENNIHTIAVLGSGLSDETIYPKANLSLAKQILDSGGCLISEFENNFSATNWSFPQRNRIMVGISDAVLIIETSQKSGTMITARLATDYNKEIMTVPGSIFSENNSGSNLLIKDGANVILESKDVLEILGFEIKIKNDSSISKNFANLSENEIKILNCINIPKTISEIIAETKLSIATINATISLLEFKELIHFLEDKICKK
ncbi:MAG TPA: DNA-processing protein DprA [Candidatus Paceibacterota bacterium]|mgnify:CR=1 FL=1|nr:DNA-processing protein DprA [Candidatus Paceibacterota bacterium]HMP19120.1 DNA-processing protein DprA [Candidatus Paceibacterota bacterium]HMP85124.1 DNA-processing protein DprA [Candidatus Paceibacterota bacterium]